MKRVRVLHVIDSLHLGGAQEVILQLVAGADRNRFEHEVATLHGRGVYWDRMRERGFKLHSLSPHKFLPLYLPALWQLLGRGRFDVLHCHLGAANLIAKPLGRWRGVRGILSHDHTNDAGRANNRVLLALDGWANRFADEFVAVSTSCRDFLVEREDIPADKITVVPNAVDTEWFGPGNPERSAARAAFGLPDGIPVVCGVGRLRPQKNFLLFLEIAAELSRSLPQARFLVAGTGPEEALLKQRAAALGIAPQVDFCGYTSDPRKVYAAADLLLMPSRFEGLPMTLLEAMASRLPVVASNLDGIAEVITHGQDGFLCEPGCAPGFVDAAQRLFEDPELRRGVGERARQRILDGYSAERMVSAVEAAYLRLTR